MNWLSGPQIFGALGGILLLLLIRYTVGLEDAYFLTGAAALVLIVALKKTVLSFPFNVTFLALIGTTAYGLHAVDAGTQTEWHGREVEAFSFIIAAIWLGILYLVGKAAGRNLFAEVEGVDDDLR